MAMGKAKVINPYIMDFINSLAIEINFVNKNNPTKYGLLDILKYIGKINIVFLNWIEEIPEKKGGAFQSILLGILLVYFKIKGIKVFYTLHNKESHYSKNKKLKRLMNKLVICNADYLMCHSSEGIGLLNRFRVKKNARYFPHPFDPIAPINSHSKDYDILIWGTIKPYKGVDKFLSYLKSNDLLDKYKTIVCGIIQPADYEQCFIEFTANNLIIKNQVIDYQTLDSYIARSKITLFTYLENSVLSSGALMYSLSRGATVIGPDTGAFHDLSKENLIVVYNNYSDLVEKIDHVLENPCIDKERLNSYIQENSWENFGKNVLKWINES